MVNQGCMSLSTYYLEYGHHLARLRRRRRGPAYTPTSNTASHDNHEKVHCWVSLDSHICDAYGAPLGGRSGRRSSAINHSLHQVWKILKGHSYLRFDETFKTLISCRGAVQKINVKLKVFSQKDNSYSCCDNKIKTFVCKIAL